MADVADVALALAYRCADVLYPSGIGMGSVTGRQTMVRRGWLLPSDMFSAQSLRNSVDYVTVTSMLDGYRVLPEPMGQAWCVDRVLAPTVGVAGVGFVARVSLGAGEVPRGVVGLAWRKCDAPCVCSAYAVTAADTPDSIAAGLSAGLPGSIVDGAEICVSDGELMGYGAGYGRSSRVVRRQSQKFRISIWTASAEARETLGACLDTVLTAANWLSLVDGHAVQMAFEGMGDVDTMQMQALYRRDLVFRITFDTVETRWSAQMMFGGGALLVGGEVDLFGDVRSAVGVQTDPAILAAETAAVSGYYDAGPYPGWTTDGFGTVQPVIT